MTQRELIEEIQDFYPDMKQQHCRVRLNRTLAKFVNRTRIIERAGTIDVTTDDIEYDFSDIEEVTASDDVLKILDVYYNGQEVGRISGEPVISSESSSNGVLAWFLRNNKIYIGLYDEGTFYYVSTALTVNVAYEGQATLLTVSNMDEEIPDVPTNFHEAPLYYALQQLAMKEGNLGKAGMWRTEWREAVRDAKIYKNDRKVGRRMAIAQQEY